MSEHKWDTIEEFIEWLQEHPEMIPAVEEALDIK